MGREGWKGGIMGKGRGGLYGLKGLKWRDGNDFTVWSNLTHQTYNITLFPELSRVDILQQKIVLMHDEITQNGSWEAYGVYSQDLYSANRIKTTLQNMAEWTKYLSLSTLVAKANTINYY